LRNEATDQSGDDGPVTKHAEGRKIEAHVVTPGFWQSMTRLRVIASHLSRAQ